MNLESAPFGVLSPRDLFKLKYRVRKISLESLSQHFVKIAKEKWNGTVVDDYESGKQSAIDIVIGHYGGESKFGRLVANEYRQFLVVKAVETIALSKHPDTNHLEESSASIMEMWKEKCQPSVLVDMFWHAHLQAPQKYALDCHELLQGMISSPNAESFVNCIINHDAGYISPENHVGSDFESKLDALFLFEKQFPNANNYLFGECIHGGTDLSWMFSKSFNLGGVAEKIWEDMHNYNDCG